MIPDLIEIGIKIENLLNSEIFCYNFDMDEWPTMHWNDSEEIRPYNKSIFQLRKNYFTVFPEDEFRPLTKTELEGEGMNEKEGLNTIRYEVNLLPNVGTHFVSRKDPFTGKKTTTMKNPETFFMTTCSESDEIEIFNAG